MQDQDPAQTALQDQSDAAFFDAVAGDVLSKAMKYGTVVIPAGENPDETRARERFLAWMAGEPRQCEHRPLEHGPAYWPMWRKMLMCVACLNAVHQEIKGTPEDRRCDVCGTVQPEEPDCIQSCSLALQIRPVAGEPLIPPILVLWGRCKTCAGAP